MEPEVRLLSEAIGGSDYRSPRGQVTAGQTKAGCLRSPLPSPHLAALSSPMWTLHSSRSPVPVFRAGARSFVYTVRQERGGEFYLKQLPKAGTDPACVDGRPSRKGAYRQMGNLALLLLSMYH